MTVLPTPTESSRIADTTASEISRQLDDAVAALEQALAEADLQIFYRAFRQTSLPFLPIVHRRQPLVAFHHAAETVKRLGTVSPAVALAVENHLYVVSALATVPVDAPSTLDARRTRLVESVVAKRLLVANTNSRVHGDKIATSGTVAKRDGDGYRVNGEAVYMSLASEGDLLVLITALDSGEPAVFACPLKGHPHIDIGPLLFADAMRESDTRKVRFDDLFLAEECLLTSGRDNLNMLPIVTYETSWHQALLAALSVGTTARAIEEGRKFLRQVRRPDGTPLAQLDGMVVDLGRLVLRYRAAAATVEQAGQGLARVAALPAIDRTGVSDAFELAAAAKYTSTACAEDVVGAVRRMIGARSFAGDQTIERLSKEVMFAPLGGEVNAVIERRAGERALGDSPFTGTMAPAPARPRKSQAAKLDKLRALARARKTSLDSRKNS